MCERYITETGSMVNQPDPGQIFLWRENGADLLIALNGNWVYHQFPDAFNSCQWNCGGRLPCPLAALPSNYKLRLGQKLMLTDTLEKSCLDRSLPSQFARHRVNWMIFRGFCKALVRENVCDNQRTLKVQHMSDGSYTGLGTNRKP